MCRAWPLADPLTVDLTKLQSKLLNEIQVVFLNLYTNEDLLNEVSHVLACATTKPQKLAKQEAVSANLSIVVHSVLCMLKCHDE